MKLVPPVSYQGGKQRFATKILDVIKPHDCLFHDLCCGAGSISIALVASGFPASNIVMVDSSPWGDFWKAVGDGTIDLDCLRAICDAVPKDMSKVKDHMAQLKDAPVPTGSDYLPTFLLLQAASFGGKAVSVVDGKWKHPGLRYYWTPTATSKRRYHTNPINPGPDLLVKRVEALAQAMRGVTGKSSDINTLTFDAPNGVYYIDPPYEGTTGYNDNVNRLTVPHWISERKPLSDQSFLMSGESMKGGITGNRQQSHEEWLSFCEVKS